MLHRTFTGSTESLRESETDASASMRSKPKSRSGGRPDHLSLAPRPRAAMPPVYQIEVRVKPPEDDSKRERRERWLIWGMSLLSALTLVGWMIWSGTAERRAIAKMPVEQRQLIYEHTLESVRAMCADRSDDDIRQRCREQAEFLLVFPECQDECQKLIDPMLRHVPTR